MTRNEKAGEKYLIKQWEKKSSLKKIGDFASANTNTTTKRNLHVKTRNWKMKLIVIKKYCTHSQRKKLTQIKTQIAQQREKMFGKAVSGVCSDMRALHSTHREREIDREWKTDREKEKERERQWGWGGIERSEWRAKKEDRINVGRAHTTAGKPDRSFFFSPFSLQLYLSLPLQALFLSIASECASAKLSPPIWHRVPERSANTHAWRAEWEGGRKIGRGRIDEATAWGGWCIEGETV